MMVSNTPIQFDLAVSQCRDIFTKKMKDYGSAWRILRVSSITDQVYIKAQRIRSIEQKGTQKVDEGIKSEFIGIVNYAAIALIQLDPNLNPAETNIAVPAAVKLFDQKIAEAKSLMENKNFDYDEAWRQMRISSLTDIILMKLMRVKQIEDHHGETLISEGIEANFHDIINYALFALIRIEESTQK